MGVGNKKNVGVCRGRGVVFFQLTKVNWYKLFFNGIGIKWKKILINGVENELGQGMDSYCVCY